MPDQDFESNCISEDEVYEGFSFRQQVKELAEYIASLAYDDLNSNKEEWQKSEQQK